MRTLVACSVVALLALGACMTDPATTEARRYPRAEDAPAPGTVEYDRAVAEQARLDDQCRTFDAIVAQGGPDVFPGARDAANPRRPQENYGCERRRR